MQTEVKRCVFHGLDVVQERNAANQVTAQLVRDGNIGGILSRTTTDGHAFYGYDGNGNVTLLTNSAGQDVGHYRYDAFGNTLEVWGTRGSENPYRFSTKELHGQSGLYDYGFRFYSPGLGRWLNRDPLGEEGGVNLYAMVNNNPINDVDLYGNAPQLGIADSLSVIPATKSVISAAATWLKKQAVKREAARFKAMFVVQNGTAAEKTRVWVALRKIYNAKRGREMVEMRRNSGRGAFVINITYVYPSRWWPGTDVIQYNPKKKVMLQTSKGP